MSGVLPAVQPTVLHCSPAPHCAVTIAAPASPPKLARFGNTTSYTPVAVRVTVFGVELELPLNSSGGVYDAAAGSWAYTKPHRSSGTDERKALSATFQCVSR